MNSRRRVNHMSPFPGNFPAPPQVPNHSSLPQIHTFFRCSYSVVHEPARAESRPGLERTRLEAPLDSRTRAQRHPDSARLEPPRDSSGVERTRAAKRLKRNRADSSPELSGCLCMLPFSFETTKQKLNTRQLNINTIDLFPLAMYLTTLVNIFSCSV